MLLLANFNDLSSDNCRYREYEENMDPTNSRKITRIVSIVLIFSVLLN